MTLFARVRRWWRTRRLATDRAIAHSRALNEQQVILTDVTSRLLRTGATEYREINRTVFGREPWPRTEGGRDDARR